MNEGKKSKWRKKYGKGVDKKQDKNKTNIIMTIITQR